MNAVAYSTFDSKDGKASQNDDLATETALLLNKSTASETRQLRLAELKEEQAFILNFNKTRKHSARLDAKSSQMLKRNMSIQTRKRELLKKKKVPASKSIKMKNLLQINKNETYYSAEGNHGSKDQALLSYRTKHRRLDQLKDRNAQSTIDFYRHGSEA